MPVLLTAEATHDRGDFGDASEADARRRADGDGLAMSADKILSQRHHLDHALIGLSRAVAEGDDAVLPKNEAFACECALKDLDRLLGEAEARHEVGHEGQPAAENLDAARFAVRLVDHAEHRGGMGVIDEFVRQERVQHDLDRRSWRRRIDQVGALDADKFVVGDGVEPAQPAQGVKPHRRQAFGFDRRHVGAGGFYPQHLDIFAEETAHAGLERGVAAAMQHQLGVAAKEPRRVDAERQVAVDAGFRTVRNECFGVTVNPSTFHGALDLSRRTCSADINLGYPICGRPLLAMFCSALIISFCVHMSGALIQERWLRWFPRRKLRNR